MIHQQLELKYETKPQMILDYSIDEPQYHGRTCIPQNGFVIPLPSNLKKHLRDTPPESDTPIGFLLHLLRRPVK
jgi:hypothetical protein